MAITPGDPGGGGAIDGGGFNCRISPSDMVGIVDNLITRIEELEAKLARIVGGDLSADQLSDISQQIGWVGGVTYMGVEGWTRTEAGTLIPPAGWSLSTAGILMSNGQPFQQVIMDENGVLQFGTTPFGQLAGQKVDYWDAGGAGGEPDYYKYNFSLGSEQINEGRNVLTSTNSMSGATTTGVLRIFVENAGLWLVQLNGTWIKSSGSLPPSTLDVLLTHTELVAGPIGNMTKYQFENWNIQGVNSIGSIADFLDPGQNEADFEDSAIFLLEAGSRISVTTSLVGRPDLGGMTFTLNKVDVNMVRLGAGI